MSKLSKLTKFLDRLDAAEIHYALSSVSEATISVSISVPEERWEVEFNADGDVEVEVFRSDGEVSDFSAVEELFENHTDA
jgi:hypothetical protein